MMMIQSVEVTFNLSFNLGLQWAAPGFISRNGCYHYSLAAISPPTYYIYLSKENEHMLIVANTTTTNNMTLISTARDLTTQSKSQVTVYTTYPSAAREWRRTHTLIRTCEK